ncbi:PGF-pre-PGF domain-containing protein [Candidatus Woesearchaeota archaeon]|nr:PGF-pre-PGF domain-containing protein [Candidatus Woesearchaeota archaeon]
MYDKWDVLPTTLLSEDENKVHYSSLTSGFSYFAIGEKTTISATKPAEQVTSEQITSTVEKKEISVTKGETRNLLIIGIILISIILIISTIFLFRYIRSIRLKRT